MVDVPAGVGDTGAGSADTLVQMYNELRDAQIKFKLETEPAKTEKNMVAQG